ncbi:MAG TPA: hypothetical protein VGH19_09710 [Verrucomicrobiae bacterium]
MNLSELMKKVGTLRAQIENDSTASAEVLEQNKPQAFRLLDEVAKAPSLPSGSGRLIAQVRNSLQDFYNPKLHSGWRHQFVLQDLKSLEDHIRSSQRSDSNDSDFFMPGLMSAG